VLCCVGCDQATKMVATTQLAGHRPMSLLADTVRLSYAENAGGFLSFGADLPARIRAWVFGLLPAVFVLALLAVILRNHSLHRRRLVAISLLVGGGAGNLVDRVVFGVVRDFLNVGIGSVRTGVFNVADLAIVTAALLLVTGWKERLRCQVRHHP